MVTINLSEVHTKNQIAKIIRKKMQLNGIQKNEIIKGANLSKTAVNSVLCVGDVKTDYRFSTLVKVLDFLKIQLYIGRNNEGANKVLSLF